jgi:succinate dehydrogenase / fumarate reductase cytochrome b subunit
MPAAPLPGYFIWRRLQSLAGFWLILFLIEHLLTNSQAALFLGDDGRGFIDGANFIHSLPYLPLIEIGLLGIPILVHGIWGFIYLRGAHMNSFPTDGSKPALTMYARNQAYSWHRITAWILIAGVALHVYNMRFLHYPQSAQVGTEQSYMVRLSLDPGLYTLGERLGYRIYTPSEVKMERAKLAPIPQLAENASAQEQIQAQRIQQEHQWVDALEYRPITEGEAIAVAKDFGTAELLVVRENFKSWTMIILYTLFVLAAVYHAFNGLWTFLITWGVILTAAAQKIMLRTAVALMVVTGFLGLSAIWLTYWVNLKT